MFPFRGFPNWLYPISLSVWGNAALENRPSHFSQRADVHKWRPLNQLPFTSREEVFKCYLFVFIQAHGRERVTLLSSPPPHMPFPYLDCNEVDAPVLPGLRNFTSFVKLVNATWSNRAVSKWLNDICWCHHFPFHRQQHRREKGGAEQGSNITPPLPVVLCVPRWQTLFLSLVATSHSGQNSPFHTISV